MSASPDDSGAPASGVLRHDDTVGAIRFALLGAVDPADPGFVGIAGSEGRREAATALGVPPAGLVFPHQVHGDRVLTVDGGWSERAPEADALVLGGPGTPAGSGVVAVGVRAADCMPLLLGDPAAGFAAAVHVGRLGLHAGIVPAAVARLRDLGATSLLARPGPTVCGLCYEVPASMRDDVAAEVPAAAARTRTGTPSLDILAGVVAQLEQSARRHDLDLVVDTSWTSCTIEDATWFSHRRDATRGRHAGVVLVAPPSPAADQAT